jgi:O-antigen ligase
MTLSEREERSAYPLYLMLLWIVATFFSWFFHKQGNWLINTVVLPLLMVPAAFWLARSVRGIRRLPPAGTLLGVFAVWYVLTRLVNADPFTADNLTASMHVLAAAFVAFPLAARLEARSRKRALVLIGALVAGVLGVVAWIAVVASFRREIFVVPFTDNMIIGIRPLEGRLNVLYMHANLSAVMFVAAIGLCLYLLVAVRSRWLRLPVAAAVIGLYVAVALTLSRTAMIIVALELGGFAFLLLFKTWRPKRKALNALVATAACVAVTAASFLGLYSLIGTAAGLSGGESSRSVLMRSAYAAEAQTEAAPSADGTSATAEAFIDLSHLSANIDTLANRTDFYTAVIPAIRNRPATLLIGDSTEHILPALQAALGREAYHWHNSFLQTLMTAGLPALLCALGFSVLLIVKCFRLVFIDKTPFADLILLLPTLGILLHGMLEAFLFVNFGLQNILFFLLAGFLFAIPGKHRWLSAA